MHTFIQCTDPVAANDLWIDATAVQAVRPGKGTDVELALQNGTVIRVTGPIVAVMRQLEEALGG